jgi:hypothetical protein
MKSLFIFAMHDKSMLDPYADRVSRQAPVRQALSWIRVRDAPVEAGLAQAGRASAGADWTGPASLEDLVQALEAGPAE